MKMTQGIKEADNNESLSTNLLKYCPDQPEIISKFNDW